MIVIGVVAACATPSLASPPRSVGGGAYDQRGGTSFRPSVVRSWSARLITPARSRLAPGEASRPGPAIRVEGPFAGKDQVFLVLDAQKAADRSTWFRVLLPNRPNGRSAWLPAAVLAVKSNPWRINVRLAARRLDLVRSGRVLQTWPVAVGQPANPTPTGRFAIGERVPQANPNGFFGPVILTLTAHSDTLSDFDGGDGRVALHGTSRPGLLGTAASHGCVRLPNNAAQRIATLVPAGTPVIIS